MMDLKLHRLWLDTEGVDGRMADFSGQSFTNEDFHGADLKRANLSGATFTDCDLTDVDFRGADLSNASLINCDCRHSRFTRAKTGGLNTKDSKTSNTIGL